MRERHEPPDRVEAIDVTGGLLEGNQSNRGLFRTPYINEQTYCWRGKRSNVEEGRGRGVSRPPSFPPVFPLKRRKYVRCPFRTSAAPSSYPPTILLRHMSRSATNGALVSWYPFVHVALFFLRPTMVPSRVLQHTNLSSKGPPRRHISHNLLHKATNHRRLKGIKPHNKPLCPHMRGIKSPKRHVVQHAVSMPCRATCCTLPYQQLCTFLRCTVFNLPTYSVPRSAYCWCCAGRGANRSACIR